MKLPKLLRGAPAADEAQQPARRRRVRRPDGPRTIIPLDDEAGAAAPSWLHAAPSTPMSLDLDAARARLKREIPPARDEDG